MSDLISLDRAIEQIPGNLNCDEAAVASMVSAASGFVENYCRRKFGYGTYTELHTITGRTPYLFVNNPPITKVVDVRTGQLPAFYVLCNDPLSQTQQATVEVSETGVELVRVYNNVRTASTFTFASYPTFTDLGTAINALGAPWSAQVPQQFALWQTSDMIQQGTWNARGVSVPLYVYYGRPYFRVNEEAGELYSPSGWTIGYQSTFVSYVGGFDVIPEPLQYACAALVGQMYSGRALNPALTSETLDKYSYTKAATQGFENLPDAVKSTLNAYKLLRVAKWK